MKLDLLIGSAKWTATMLEDMGLELIAVEKLKEQHFFKVVQINASRTYLVARSASRDVHVWHQIFEVLRF